MPANLEHVIKWGTRVKKITSSTFNARDLLDVTFWQSSPVHLDSDKSFGNWISPDDGHQAKEKTLVFVQFEKCICPNYKLYSFILTLTKACSPDDGDQAEEEKNTCICPN